MSFGVKVKVWGDYACFTRPEMKVERVSYDVITPSAARAVIEAIYWKPAIRWVIDRIHVMKPVKFDNIRRNEVDSKLSISAGKIATAMENNEAIQLFADDSKHRRQRAAMVLRDVEYIIEAHFEPINSEGENIGKHLDMFNRRAKKGQCFYQPYLGTREFSSSFELVEGDIPASQLTGERDLGFMLFDIDFSDKKNIQPMFYRPKMVDGVIAVPHPDSGEVLK
ncbi:type I-C CRISPR-associated protein Cas5c [Chitinivibrio alkaliphilus]|uniref:pre-crRNA processing endonuclease n=1 Tax=Chitinivibrio alkaliphilus ACht1 TaxID=1313304 RepID=U7D7W7_9BACT|nr:type I-C CRISPR-associated protein Cas5c [Chitinivibrio alkaliphilus]ERP31666.1 CRISPR/Cas system-associated RAMP superfamily protein Cas5 [Chitinivibrio alkaliphilus ACht1]